MRRHRGREGGRERRTYCDVLPSVGKVDVLLVQGQNLGVGDSAGEEGREGRKEGRTARFSQV